ncbi:MAG: hypothetical protein WEB58_00410 [Planctomycetaceae bacterium]
MHQLLELYPDDASIVWADGPAGKVVLIDYDNRSIDANAMLSLSEDACALDPVDAKTVAFLRTVDEGLKDLHVVTLVNIDDGSVVLRDWVYGDTTIDGTYVEVTRRIGTGDVVNSRTVGVAVSRRGELSPFLAAIGVSATNRNPRLFEFAKGFIGDQSESGDRFVPYVYLGRELGRQVRERRISPALTADVIRRDILRRESDTQSAFLDGWKDGQDVARAPASSMDDEIVVNETGDDSAYCVRALIDALDHDYTDIRFNISMDGRSRVIVNPLGQELE